MSLPLTRAQALDIMYVASLRRTPYERDLPGRGEKLLPCLLLKIQNGVTN